MTRSIKNVRLGSASAEPPVVYEIDLRERMVRVEEELKHQRELMQQGFEQVQKRFEQVDKRFGEMLKRHDQQFLWLIGFIATGDRAGCSGG